MASGMWFEVDMSSAQTFNEITMDSAGSANDYARGYAVYVSNDGMTWGNPIATGTGTAALITVTFPAQTAQYIQVVQTGAADYWWSIAEFNVYAP
jgi:phage-related protein